MHKLPIELVLITHGNISSGESEYDLNKKEGVK